MLQQKPNKINGFELPHTPASNQSLEYIAELTNIDIFNICVFPEKNKPKNKPFLKIIDKKTGKREDACWDVSINDIDIPELKRRNEYQNIGFRPNRDKKWYCFRIEYDEIPLEEQIPLVESLCEINNLPLPTFYIYTGNKSYHFYWILENPLDREIGYEINYKLVYGIFKGCDDNFESLHQISRLPGYKHLSTGKESILYEGTKEKYTIDDFSSLSEVEIPEDKKYKKTNDKGFEQIKVEYNGSCKDKLEIIREELKEVKENYTFNQLSNKTIKTKLKEATTKILNTNKYKDNNLYFESLKLGSLLVLGISLDEALDTLEDAILKKLKTSEGLFSKAQKTIANGLLVGFRNSIIQGYLNNDWDFTHNLEINQQFIDSTLLDSDKKLIALKSPIGTGKTTAIKQFVEKNKGKRILVITHRVSLVESFNENFYGLDFHRYDDFYQKTRINKTSSQKLITTLDSTHHLFATNQETIPYDIIILDELDQNLEHLVKGETEIKNYRYHTELLLRFFLVKAKKIIVSSATLSDLEINALKEFTISDNEETTIKDNDILKIKNVHKPLIKNFIDYKNRSAIVDKIYNSLNNNEKIAICSNSQEECELLNEQLIKKYPDKKIEVIHGDNSSEEKQIKLIKALINEKKELDIDVLIYSPSLGTGFDISRKYFDNVFLIANRIDALSSQDLLQLVGRVRYPKNNTVHVFIENGLIRRELNKDEIKNKYLEVCELPYNIDLISGKWKPVNKHLNDAHINYLVNTEIRKNKSVQYLNVNFWKLVKENGHIITNNKTSNNNDVINELKETKKELKEKKLNLVFNSETIDDNKFAELMNKKEKEKIKLNEKEKAELDKYFYFKNTGFEDISLELLDWYFNHGIKMYSNIKYLLMPDKIAQIKDIQEKQIKGTLQNDCNNFLKKKTLLEDAFNLIKDAFYDISSKSEVFIDSFYEETLNISGFSDWIIENEKDIRYYLDFKPDINNPVRTANSFLKTLGLEVEKRRIRRIEDGNLIWVYWINKDSFSKFNKLVEHNKDKFINDWIDDLRYLKMNPALIKSENASIQKLLTDIEDVVNMYHVEPETITT